MSGLDFVVVSIKGMDKIKQFDNWQPSLEYWLGVAETESLRRLKLAAQSNMRTRFKNPTGVLEENTVATIDSYNLPVISGQVMNDSPYAWRREEGFSGMTDSIGRFFPDDPGVYYMSSSLVSEYDWIRKKFQWAINKALKELTAEAASAGGTP